LAVNNFVATSNQRKSWHAARIFCFNKSFERNYAISTGIPNLKVLCKKSFNWTVGVGQKNRTPTPTPSVLRNPTLPTLTPPKNLWTQPGNSASVELLPIVLQSKADRV